MRSDRRVLREVRDEDLAVLFEQWADRRCDPGATSGSDADWWRGG